MKTPPANLRRLLRSLAFSLALLLLLAPLASRAQTGTLRIAAAADLEPVLPAVLQQFEQQTGLHAQATYQSSATLAQQIVSGAPFDLFLAADLSFPQRVIDAGLANETKPLVYARGTLVLWARHDSPALHGRPLSMDILRDPSLHSVAIANPEHAPYGRAAQSAIAALQLQPTLAPKLRVAANIAQAAQYADSGNAELGFLSLTGASTPKLQADGVFIPVPASAYPPILQGAVILRRAAKPSGAARLLDFLRTPATRTLLQQKGLLPPP